MRTDISQLTRAETTDVTKELNALMNSMNKLETIEDMYDEYEFFDDVLNKPLDKEEAIKARRLEIDFFRTRKVYEKVPRHLAAGHKIISTKWLDVDMRDKQRPSRELKLNDRRLDLFAATPPLESLRLLCSICASNHMRARPYRLLSIDVKRAYFDASVQREILIEIILEGWEPGDESKVEPESLWGPRRSA